MTIPADESGLYHVSEKAGITCFEPRKPQREVAGLEGPVVWAVDGDHLCNYLLPRDCPRVTFRAGPGTTTDDTEKFLSSEPLLRVVAVESGWLPAIGSARLHLYRFDPAGFVPQDSDAGYSVCSSGVTPLDESVVDDPARAIHESGALLHVLDSLWDLREEVIRSTLEYSIIRMGYAEPPHDQSRYHPLP